MMRLNILQFSAKLIKLGVFCLEFFAGEGQFQKISVAGFINPCSIIWKSLDNLHWQMLEKVSWEINWIAFVKQKMIGFYCVEQAI